MAPNNFLTSQVEQGISVVTDAQETLTGKYNKVYYACKTSSGANLLTEVQLPSGAYRSIDTSDQYMDFDLTIDRKTNIEGRAIICLTQEIAGSSPDTEVEIRISGAKVVGGTASEISGAYCQTPYTGGTQNRAERKTVFMDIPKTKFLRGDKFRLSVLKNQRTGAATTALYHDPASRLTSAYGDGEHTNHPTTFVIILPFAEQAEY